MGQCCFPGPWSRFTTGHSGCLTLGSTNKPSVSAPSLRDTPRARNFVARLLVTRTRGDCQGGVCRPRMPRRHLHRGPYACGLDVVSSPFRAASQGIVSSVKGSVRVNSRSYGWRATPGTAGAFHPRGSRGSRILEQRLGLIQWLTHRVLTYSPPISSSPSQFVQAPVPQLQALLSISDPKSIATS